MSSIKLVLTHLARHDMSYRVTHDDIDVNTKLVPYRRTQSQENSFAISHSQ